MRYEKQTDINIAAVTETGEPVPIARGTRLHYIGEQKDWRRVAVLVGGKTVTISQTAWLACRDV